ncbi:MAG TPA: aldehyde dehydrogenase family protein, partial [Candidatus Thermoplasmatota archaeon]
MSQAAVSTPSPRSAPQWEHLHKDELFRPLIASGPNGVPRFRNFIGGKWRDGSKCIPVTTPIDGTVIGEVPDSNAAEIEAALQSAHESRRAIRDLPGHARIDLFERAAQMILDHKATLEEVLMLEAGKPAHDRHAEVNAASMRLRATHLEARKIYGEYLPGDWAQDTVGKMALVIREPLGVVACIGPFNYPLFIPTAKITPALLAGNTVVAKGSHQTPLSLFMFARILESAGLPPGTFNVITGQGTTVGEA